MLSKWKETGGFVQAISKSDLISTPDRRLTSMHCSGACNFFSRTPRIQRLNADLKPGLTRGEGILDVRVEERPPYRLYSEYNNYQSPSVGENRGLVSLEHENVTGNGDILWRNMGDRQVSIRCSISNIRCRSTRMTRPSELRVSQKHVVGDRVSHSNNWTSIASRIFIRSP